MDYQRIYDQIIEKAKKEKRVKKQGTYYEKHHIKPKCLGGSNDTSNLVLLTAKEHYLCHKILHSLNPENKKLAYAFTAMFANLKKRNYQPSAKAFEENKILIAKLKTSVSKSKEAIEKRTATRIERGNYKRTREAVLKGIEVRKQKNSYRYEKTDNHKQKLADAHRGLKYSRTKCPACGKEVAINAARRWHFDNCKKKLENK